MKMRNFFVSYEKKESFVSQGALQNPRSNQEWQEWCDTFPPFHFIPELPQILFANPQIRLVWDTVSFRPFLPLWQDHPAGNVLKRTISSLSKKGLYGIKKHILLGSELQSEVRQQGKDLNGLHKYGRPVVSAEEQEVVIRKLNLSDVHTHKKQDHKNFGGRIRFKDRQAYMHYVLECSL